MRFKYALTGFFFGAATFAAPTKSTQKISDIKTQNKRIQRADLRGSIPLKLQSESGIRDIQEALKATNHLISKLEAGPQRNRLLLNKAISYFTLGRYLQVRTKNLKLGERERKFFIESEKAADQVISSPHADKPMQANALFVKGLVNLYLDKSSRSFFERSIELDPGSENAPWSALTIAEDYFEEGDFTKALSFYRGHWSRFDDKQKELASYKIAWCFLNLLEYRKAIDSFLYVIKSDVNGQYGRDSIKDLAYVSTQLLGEDEILALNDRHFANDNEKMRLYLSAVMSNYEVQNKVNQKSPLFKRLSMLQNDPAKEAELLLAGVRSKRKDYASRAHFDAFKVAVEQLTKVNSNKTTSQALKTSVDSETQKILQAYIETYSGRVKTPENIPQNEMAEKIKYLAAFYTRAFPESPQLAPIAKAWLQVCTDTKDHQCTYSVAATILKATSLEKIHQFALYQQLVALDALRTKDRQLYTPLLLKKAELYLKQYPQSEEWLDIAKRSSDVLMSEKRISEALPILERIYNQAKTPDNFYRIQLARFENHNYQEILNDTREDKGTRDPRVSELRREASLKIAVDARSSKNSSQYRLAMKDFLALAPTPEKKWIAQKDYLAFLVNEDKSYEEFVDLLLQVDPKYRGSSELEALKEKAWRALVASRKYKKAALIDEVPTAQKRVRPSASSNYRIILNSLLQNRPFDFKSIIMLDDSRRLYLLSLLALLQNETAYSYFKEFPQRSGKNPKDRDIALLTLQIKQDSAKLTRDVEAEKILGRSFPFVVPQKPVLVATERIFSRIVFPTKEMSASALAPILTNLITRVRELRKVIARELPQATIEAQLNAVQRAREVELKIATLILESKAPEGISEEDLSKYRSELETAAQEFKGQASEFEKIESALVKTVQERAANNKAELLKVPSQSEWFWPPDFSKNAPLSMVDAEIKAKKFLPALVLLDIGKVDAQISEEDYWRARSGILLYANKNDFIKSYVFEEIKNAGQNELLKKWERVK